MSLANEKRYYIVTSSLIAWAHTQNGLCIRGKSIHQLKWHSYSFSLTMSYIIQQIFFSIVMKEGPRDSNVPVPRCPRPRAHLGSHRTDVVNLGGLEHLLQRNHSVSLSLSVVVCLL